MLANSPTYLTYLDYMANTQQYSFSQALSIIKQRPGLTIKATKNRDLARFKFTKDGHLQALSAVRGLWQNLVNIPITFFTDDEKWEVVEDRAPEVMESVEVLGIDLTPHGNDGLYNLTIAAQVDKKNILADSEYFTNRRCKITIEALED